MKRVDMWTDEEIEIIERNYPKYGYSLEEWDATVNRSERAVKAKALRLGLACSAKFGTRLKESDRKKLRVVAEGLCEKLGLSMRGLAREIAVFSNDDTVARAQANKIAGGEHHHE